MLNNVALAAKFALTRQGVERVVILDFDVHHGQVFLNVFEHHFNPILTQFQRRLTPIQHYFKATQQCFESSSQVLYISIHRYDNGRFYPCGTKGGANQVGKGTGKGYNVNIPWNASGKPPRHME